MSSGGVGAYPGTGSPIIGGGPSNGGNIGIIPIFIGGHNPFDPNEPGFPPNTPPSNPKDDWGQDLPSLSGIFLDASLSEPQYSKVKSVVEDMIANNSTIQPFLDHFRALAGRHGKRLVIKVAPLEGGFVEASTSAEQGVVTITFNSKRNYAGVTFAEIARTFVHELLHAYIHAIIMDTNDSNHPLNSPDLSEAQIRAFLSTLIGTDKQFVYDYYFGEGKNYYNQAIMNENSRSSAPHHNIIADLFLEVIAQAVMEYTGASATQLDSYIALAWQGLDQYDTEISNPKRYEVKSWGDKPENIKKGIENKRNTLVKTLPK